MQTAQVGGHTHTLHGQHTHNKKGTAWRAWHGQKMGGLLAEIMKNMCVQMQRKNTHTWAKETHTHGHKMG